jgi:hypothetical protein
VTNPRYFTDGTKSVFLSGEHNPIDFQDWAGATTVDYTAYINNMAAKGHNLIRLWGLDNIYPAHLDGSRGKVNPLPFKRTGPGTSAEPTPGLKFDLTQYEQTYFDRLRARVIQAGNAGIYTIVMVSTPIFRNDSGNFTYSMYNPTNNINGSSLGSFTNGDQWTLNNSTWVGYMDGYVNKLVDTLADLNNVLYEIGNEGPIDTSSWQDHVMATIRTREAGNPKKHMVGKTAYDSNSTDSAINTNLTGGTADWISISGRTNGYGTVDVSPSNKVDIYDSDHIIGFTPNADEATAAQWIWKSLTRGHNVLFLQTPNGNYPGLSGSTPLLAVEAQLGYAKTMANRCDLLHMAPSASTSSTGFAMVNPGAEYLVYQPNNSSFTVTLPSGTFSVEWMNPTNGAIISASNLSTTNGNNNFNLPSGLTSGVLHLILLTNVPTPTPTATATATAAPTPTPTPTATSTPIPTPTPTPVGQFVNSFTLINADSDQPIQTLTNGATLNLATLPTKNLNVRANTVPTPVGSVVFALTGAQTRNQTEATPPYALFGDTGGDYAPWTPALGSYTLKATPFSGSGGTGTAGTPLTITFTVINQ